MPARMSAHNNNDESTHHAPLCPPHSGRPAAFAVVSFFLNFHAPIRARLCRAMAHGRVCPIRSGLPLRAEVCAGRCVTLNTLERNIMRKTSLALAVAASTLGLSQVAVADFIGDSKASLTMRNFYFDQNTVNTPDNNSEAS